MNAALEKEKLKLDEQKQKILLKEKILKEKEKRKRAKNFNEVGRIAFKANIDQLEKEALLGAFLEISKLVNEKNIEQWKKTASLFLKDQNEVSSMPLSIRFKTDPSNEIKNQLKARKFKWNRFRKEYYGYGDKKEIQHMLNSVEFHLDEIS